MEPVRHLDQVGLARNSGEVTQQDEQRRVAKDLAERDRGAVRLVDKQIRQHT